MYSRKTLWFFWMVVQFLWEIQLWRSWLLLSSDLFSDLRVGLRKHMAAAVQRACHISLPCSGRWGVEFQALLILVLLPKSGQLSSCATATREKEGEPLGRWYFSHFISGTDSFNKLSHANTLFSTSLMLKPININTLTTVQVSDNKFWC